MTENKYTNCFIAEERYEFYKPKNEFILYNYHHTDGAEFSCIEQSVAMCRVKRDAWIKESYLLATNQIVTEIASQDVFLVFNANLKGYVVLINLKSGKIVRIQRDRFFYKYKLNQDSSIPEIMHEQKAYLLMLEAYIILVKIIKKKKHENKNR